MRRCALHSPPPPPRLRYVALTKAEATSCLLKKRPAHKTGAAHLPVRRTAHPRPTPVAAHRRFDMLPVFGGAWAYAPIVYLCVFFTQVPLCPVLCRGPPPTVAPCARTLWPCHQAPPRSVPPHAQQARTQQHSLPRTPHARNAPQHPSPPRLTRCVLRACRPGPRVVPPRRHRAPDAAHPLERMPGRASSAT